MKTISRYFRMLMAAVLVLSMLPAAALGEGTAAGTEGGVTISAVGAYLQRLDKNNKAQGTGAETLVFDDTAAFQVTADKAKNIDYWVIDGVRYDFNKTVKSIVVTNVKEDMTFEVVYKKNDSRTLHPDGSRETGEEALVVKAVNAKMCHMLNATKGAGGWFTEFDFTQAYSNRATNKMENGGRVTVKVTANIPKNKKVRLWKFNDAELKFNSGVTTFVVRGLDKSMVYEPVFAKAAAAAPVTEPPAQTTYYRVVCDNCTFTGGGYTNAKIGSVPAGTRITLKGTGYNYGHWTINGTSILREGGFSITVNSVRLISFSPVIY